MSSPDLSDAPRGGGYRCEEYELRITRRCLEEDLDYFDEVPFEDLSKHEIVKALINRRADGPTDTREIAPLDHGKTVYRLAYGDRHRGATWHDRDHGVVWLLAYAQHEFEGRGDAFPYFKELDAESRLLPGPADYERLLLERDRLFAETVKEDAEALLRQARAQPGAEHRGHLGGRLGVGIAIVVVEPLEEVYVAIDLPGTSREDFVIVFAALFPDRAYEDIESVESLPTRPIAAGELGFRVLND